MNKLKKVLIFLLTIAAICLSLFSFVACDKDKGPDTGAREKTAYERYIEAHPEYDGTEEEWLDAVIRGTLGKENGVTITFVTDENADAPFAQITVDEGEAPMLNPGTPEKTGYEFVAWTYEGYEWSLAFPLWHDITVKASWTLKKYNLTYNLNGGTSDNATSYDIEHGFSLTDATRDYYDFCGWYTSENFDNANKVELIETGSYGDLELFAKWTPTVYSINYKGIDGATLDAEKPTSYTVESESFTLPCPEKSYYNFVGWTSETDATPDKNISVSKGSNGNVVYTANWVPTIFNISYDVGGGVNPADALQEYTINSFENADYLTLPTPSKASVENIIGYTMLLNNNFNIEYSVSEFTFGGWYKADDVNREHCYETVQLSDGNLNLVAYWIETNGKTLAKTAPYCREGDVILMGSYPQSEVTDEATLTGLAEFEFDMQNYFNSFKLYTTGTIPPLVEGWTDSGEKYWYKDVEYNGKKYRGLFVVRSRDDSSRQEQAGYAPSIIQEVKNRDVKIHWFNYDPLKWSVVDEGNGKAFLVCRTKLETMKFGHDTWAQSPIREYLNETIYNVIFNDEQKATVLKSTVANDIKSMGGYGVGHENFATYATDDYLFLLSYEELNLYKSKFVSGVGASSYCVATLSKGNIWTRSHCKYQQNSDSRLLAFNGSGEIAEVNPEYTELGHILPAMRITL